MGDAESNKAEIQAVDGETWGWDGMEGAEASLPSDQEAFGVRL